MLMCLLTVQVVRGGAGGAELGPLTRETVTVAAGTGELVAVQVGPGGAVSVPRHSTQQGVWVENKAPLTLSALVRRGAPAACTSLVTFCTNRNGE